MYKKKFNTKSYFNNKFARDSTMSDFNKNEKQLYFNQLKGCIVDIEHGDEYSNVTLVIGHENTRHANFCMKSNMFNKIIADYKIGDKVSVKYYINSNKKNGRWYTNATLLSIENY